MSRERSILLATAGAAASATVVTIVGVTAALGGFPTEVPVPPAATPVAVVVPVDVAASASSPPRACSLRSVAAVPAGSSVSPDIGRPGS